MPTDSKRDAEATAPAAPPKAPIPVRVEAPRVKRGPADVTRDYWIGLTGDAPRDQFAIAGVEFEKHTKWIDGEPDTTARLGRIRALSATQVEAIRKDVLNFVVRERGAASENSDHLVVRKRDVLDVRGADPRYAPHQRVEGGTDRPILTYRAPAGHEPQDEPMACYVFMYEVVPGMALPDVPEPMAQRAVAALN